MFISCTLLQTHLGQSSISSLQCIMEAAGIGGKMVRQRVATKDKSMNNPEDCPVCLTTFDESVQRPRTLPCGHTLCTLCIHKLIEQGHMTCPECRTYHAVPEGGQFPVCYTLEAVIKRLQNAEVAATASLPLSSGKRKESSGAFGQKEVAGLSKKISSFLEEQEARVLATITTCQEVQSQLEQYQTTLMDWGEQQQHLEDRLQELVNETKNAKELVWLEKSRAATKKEEVNKGEQQLKTVLETLHAPLTDQEAGLAIAEVVVCIGSVEQAVAECHESFPDVNTVTTIKKVREISKATLEAAEAVKASLGAHPVVTTQRLKSKSYMNSTIVDRLQTILMPNLKTEDLHHLTQPTRNLFEAGQVFAVHQVKGQSRYARLSLEAGQIYLHSLKNHPLPPAAVTIQASELVPASLPCLVFLDLAWPGSTPQRVLIHLTPDTIVGQQFMILCTGQRGPSYANTRLFKVVNKGEEGECVFGGDYERNDETGGAALLPSHKGEPFRNSRWVGSVWGRWINDPGFPTRGAQFGIRIRERLDNKFGGTIGKVVAGLDVVAAAAHYRDITEVKVVDCGVVLFK